MGDVINKRLSRKLQLADQVITATLFKQECFEIKSKTSKLSDLLHQAACYSSELYERPTRRIINETELVLKKALSLAQKCRASGLLKRAFTIIPTASFRKVYSQLDNSVGDFSWLLRVSGTNDNDDGDDVSGGYLGLPPIAANEPILCLIWEQIAIVSTGTFDARADAAASLVSLVRGNDRYGKLIIEEGGVVPLCKLLKEGKTIQGRENAARALGLLGRDPKNGDHMVRSGVCGILAKVLKNGSMKVQAMIAWAVSELAGYYPKCQDIFAQHNVIRYLVGHLSFETVEEHSNYTIAPNGNCNCNGSNLNGKLIANDRERETEDAKVKANLKAMSARALWKLSKGNSMICRSICELRALLCFAVLIEKGEEEVKYNSIMALMEITTVAEKDSELRRANFKPNSPACKAVVDQMLGIIIEEGDSESEMLVPCVKAIGNLSRTFKATETRMIGPLVKLLDEREAEVVREVAIALSKFAGFENYLHVDHSKAIIASRGIKHLVQLVYFGEQMVKIPALVLLCYIGLNVPDNEELAQCEVVNVLEWASKQSHLVQDESRETLLLETKTRLELFQSRS